MSTENFIEIDADALDTEWLKQASLFHEYSERVADAKQEWEQRKLAADVIEAEVELEFRKDPDAAGLDKVTEGVIKAAVTADERVQEAKTAVIEARHEHDILAAAVSGLDHKKRALEKLVDLHGMDYFSTPRAAKPASAEVEKRMIRKKATPKKPATKKSAKKKATKKKR